MDYYNKYLKYKSKYLKLKNQTSGGNFKIKLKQIQLSRQIEKTIKSINPNIDLDGFNIVNDGTFRLTRMEDMLKADIKKLLKNEPIQVRTIQNNIVNINDQDLQLYEIINGRHRVSKAIIDKLEEIDVQII